MVLLRVTLLAYTEISWFGVEKADKDIGNVVITKIQLRVSLREKIRLECNPPIMYF
jgi:hypothetical protein